MQLDEEDKVILEELFTEKEVACAIGGMKSKSAPEPNGFTVIFFKKIWDHIKQEIMGMVRDSNEARLDLQRLNYGVITLVPKASEANSIKQYKSICLLNVDFKFFPKLLMNILTPMVGKLIRPNQTTFIKGRNILEGVVILHEVINEFKKSDKQGVLFKIDFGKAYDKVKWKFVQEVLTRLSYGNGCNKLCPHYRGGVCININGDRTSYFRTF
jgi:hypothetical protein